MIKPNAKFGFFFNYSNWLVLGKLATLLVGSHTVILKENQKKTWIYSMLEDTLRVKSSNRIIPSSRCDGHWTYTIHFKNIQ